MKLIIGKNFGFLKKKRVVLFFGGALTILIPIIVFLVLRPGKAEAAWYNDNWKYRKAIPITNNTSTESDVYTAFDGSGGHANIDTSSLDVQSDCGDLRFTKQNGDPLPYVYNSGCTTASTDVDVFFDNFPAGEQTIYMYYGNPTIENGTEASAFSTEATNYTIGTLASEEIGPGPVGSWSFDEGYETGEAQPLTQHEQQINILTQQYATSSTSYVPTDNSLGIIHWDADKYTGATVYFEADIRGTSTGGSPTFYAALYKTDGSYVSGSQVSLFASTTWTRLRSSSITLTDDTDYTVRVKRTNLWDVQIRGARLVIVQSDGTKITDTETQIEIGDDDTTVSTSYEQLTDPKIYYYDSSKFDPEPTAYFEASLKGDEDPKIEQQINILDQEYSIGSQSWLPTDNSLGIIHWDEDKYPGATVYFEAIIRGSGTGGSPYYQAGLFTTGGSQVSNSTVELFASTAWTRVRSSALTLTDDTDYTVRIRRSITYNDTYIRAARLVIIQSDGTKITDTETQIEVGDAESSFTNTSYSELTYPKYYMYDQDVFSPTPESNSGDVTFSASLKIDSTEDTVYAELYNKTNSTVVAEVSHSGDTSWTLVTAEDVDSDSDWDTTNDDEYVVRIKCADGGVDGCSGNIANAKISLYQSSTAGITDIETVSQHINQDITDTDSTYTDKEFDNRFNPGLGTFQVTFANADLTYYFESTMKTDAGTAYAALHNDTAGSNITGSEITTPSTSFIRVRSGDITSNMPDPDSHSAAQNMDTQLKNSSTNTTTASSSWLITQVSNLSTTGPANTYVELYNLTDGTSVAGSETSSSTNTWGRYRSSSFPLTTDKEYVVRYKTSLSTGLGKISNAKVILDQSDTADGIYTVETVHQMINTPTTDADSTYSDKEFIIRYDPANNGWSSSINESAKASMDFEVTMKTSNESNAAYARLKNDTNGTAITGSEVTTDGTGYTRVRTSVPISENMPTTAKNMDTQLKNASTSTTTVSNSSLIITNDNTNLSLYYDSTSNQNHGYSGYTTTQNDCHSNYCLEFDGANSYIVIEDDAVLDFEAADDFTITGWFKHTEISSGTETILAKYETSGADGGYKIYMESDGDVTFAIDDDNTFDPDDSATSTDATYDDNTWHHFAAIKTGTTKIDLYIDGVLVATDDTISASSTLENDDDLYIGIDEDGSSNPFDGILDEIKIYPYARSADEVKTDFVGSSSAFEEKFGFVGNGLVGYWDLDEESGDASDSSGNDYTLTNNNSTTYVDGMFGTSAEFVAVSTQYFNSSSTIDTVKSVAFWVKPDNTTNYYAQMSDSAYITSSSGTLSATGFNDPKIYVNGKQSTTLNGTNWQHVVVTTDTAVESNLFYLGRQDTNYFDGKIDDFRLYNRVLPRHEIDALYRWSPGTVGYWSFDEGAGTSSVYDRSGNNNTGTMSGFSDADWTLGQYGNALNFDGSEDSVSVSDDATLDFGTGSFTVEAWINHDGVASATEQIITKVDDTNGGYKLYMDPSGDICFVTDDDSSWDTDDSACTSGVDYDDGVWHHVAGVKTGTSGLELFVDGNSVATDSSIADTNTLSNSGDLYIGVDFDGTTDYFDGKIDDVRVYNYARSPQEIITDMNADHPVPGSPIGSSKLHLEFDEMYGDTVFDMSGEENNGDLAGSGITCPGSDPACPDWTLDGKYNSAISFDNTGEYIQMSDTTFNPGTNDFTISAWVTSSANDISARIFSGGYYEYELWSPGGTNNIRAHVGNQSDAIIYSTSTGVNIEDGNWHHIAASFDRDGDLTLYVDGEIADSDDISSYSSYDYDPATVRVGNFNGTTEYGWLGEIDDVRIYHSALTYDQVKVLYNRSSAAVLGATGTESSGDASFSADRSYCPPGDVTASCGPISIWNFDEYAGTSANDTSGNGYTGTLAAGDSSPSWTMGKFGPGLKFDGDNDYVDIDTGPSSVKTIEFWTNPDTTTEYFINLTSTTDYIWSNSGTVTATGLASPTIYVNGIATDTLTTGEWQHVVITTDTAENASNFDIGRTANTNYMEGHIDNVRLYDYALSQAQVAWNFNRGAPIGYFELDECEGTTAYDISGRENHGTINIGAFGSNTSAGTCQGSSGEAWADGSSGKINYSLELDGSDDYITIGNIDEYELDDDGDISISAWINRDGVTTFDVIVAKRNDAISSTENGYALYVASNGRVQFRVGDGSNHCNIYTPISSIDDGQWYHIAATFDGSVPGGEIYINGVLSSDMDACTHTGVDNSLDFTIGAESDGGQPFYGQVDDVKIFNYVLTAQQVLTDMNQASSIRFAPVTGAP